MITKIRTIIKNLLKKMIVTVYRLMSLILPVRKDIVLFMSNMGKNYSGNPRAVSETLRKMDKTGRIKQVWAFTGVFLNDKDRCDMPKNCIVVQYGGFRYYYYLAVAGKWVFDTRQEPYLRKRKGCTYIQTWHGTPLKRLGLDIKELNMAGEKGAGFEKQKAKTGSAGAEQGVMSGTYTTPKDIALNNYYESFRQESKKWDYLIAQNDFSATTFKRCFDYHGKILLSGYPRNDVLVKAAGKAGLENNPLKRKIIENTAEPVKKINNIADNIRTEITANSTKKINGSPDGAGMSESENNTVGNISGENASRINKRDDRFVLLYAPTWRDDKYLDNGWYAYDSPLDFEKLEKEIGDTCRIIVKLHYLVRPMKNDIPLSCLRSGFVTICGNDTDIASLYIQADGLITDYSSVMFDYAVLKRKMFFFAYDLDVYRDKLRGFYFDFCSEAPGPISVTTEKLAEHLRAAFVEKREAEDYIRRRYEAFEKKYTQYDDGHASERIAGLILG